MAESHIAKLCPLFEVELDSINERNERYARMRAMNAEIRDLKQQLGERGTASQTQAHVRQSFAKLKNWWRKAGFGHIQDMQVTEYGSIQATFSCSLYGDFYLTGSSTPVSDKENKKLWHASLAGRGFQLGFEPGDREPVLIDCDDSRRALESLFAEAFSSGKMTETTNHYNGRSGDVVLRSVRVVIRDMQDILNLSVPDTSDL